MPAELQFAAIALFLIWCMASAASGSLWHEDTDRRGGLVWRDRTAAGRSDWRARHLDLTGPEPLRDGVGCGHSTQGEMVAAAAQ